MSRKFLILMAAVILFAAGCGTAGPGTPGSTGSEDTNAVFTVDFDSTTSTVEICDSSVTSVDVTIEATKMLDELPGHLLTVEGFTIEYIPQTLGAQPIEQVTYYRIMSFNLVSGKGEEVTDTKSYAGMPFFDFNSKSKYIDNINSYNPADPYPYYVAYYTFFGQDEFGHEFTFNWQNTFRIHQSDPDCIL